MHGLLGEAVEELSPRGGFAPVESKRELIEVVVEMLEPNGALMGAEQPTFEQGDHPMDPRQQVFALGLSALSVESSK